MLVRRILFFVFSVTVGTIFVKAYRAITSPGQGDTVQSAASTKSPGSLPALQKPFRFGKTGLYGVDAKKKKLVFDRNGRFKVGQEHGPRDWARQLRRTNFLIMDMLGLELLGHAFRREGVGYDLCRLKRSCLR
jgi:hypothetical protein